MRVTAFSVVFATALVPVRVTAFSVVFATALVPVRATAFSVVFATDLEPVLATAFSVVRATALVPDFATALVERVRFTGFLAAAAFAASISALVRRLALALPLKNSTPKRGIFRTMDCS